MQGVAGELCNPPELRGGDLANAQRSMSRGRADRCYARPPRGHAGSTRRDHVLQLATSIDVRR
jgi:hypothetical protein